MANAPNAVVLIKVLFITRLFRKPCLVVILRLRARTAEGELRPAFGMSRKLRSRSTLESSTLELRLDVERGVEGLRVPFNAGW